MNIQRKEQKPQQKTPVAVSSYNKAAFRENLQGIVPVGKYKDKSLQWVINNDKSYYSWMKDQGVMYSWGMLQLIDSPIKTSKPKWDQFHSESTGEYWVMIRFIETGISNNVTADNLQW